MRRSCRSDGSRRPAPARSLTGWTGATSASGHGAARIPAVGCRSRPPGTPPCRTASWPAKRNMPRAADPTREQPITRTVLLDARLRQVKDTGRVEIREIRILPGHAAGLQVHNGPVDREHS
jgi:hypothetical protein